VSPIITIFAQSNIQFTVVVKEGQNTEQVTIENLENGIFEVQCITHNHSREAIQTQMAGHEDIWGHVSCYVAQRLTPDDARFVSVL
jgi:hypothetical protein